MKSIKDVFKIGKGPSSSHTMGPSAAMLRYISDHPDACGYEVILYGSLAKTGKGHGTDVAVRGSSPKPINVIYDEITTDIPHENTMDIFSVKNDGTRYAPERYMSIGGGDIVKLGEEKTKEREIYHEKTFEEIAQYCMKEGIRLSDFVVMREGEEIYDFLYTVWDAMKASIHDGLVATGVLPGGLGVERKARVLYNKRHIDESQITRENRIVCAYAYAVSEQNADNGIIVTAPTCGSCAVVPSVLKYMQEKHAFSDKQILRALAVAGLIGTIVKTNASVSGAECGCQAEIGTACSMAATSP